MPWREMSSMEQRVQFIADYLGGQFTMTELCERHRVSRPTGYKWVERHRCGAGLQERSRRPHHSPQATAEDVAQALIEFRRRHPHWGARKLVARLQLRAPDRPWPGPSAAHEILRRAGCVSASRRRRPLERSVRRPLNATAPNTVWTIDFKGEFRTRDGMRCYPLTLMDACTRYLLACRALQHPRTAPTRRVLERAFQAYGLPDRIRSDNGSPFVCNAALGRLSPLMVWWLHLGIVPERIQPGCPSQNGRHERMHRTLKRHTARPPAPTLLAQQRRFTAFQTEYNEERPHESLGQLAPALVYVPSGRAWPVRLPALEYPGHFERRRVMSNGCMRWKGVPISVSAVLRGEDIGLEEIGDGEWAVHVGLLRVGTFDERLHRIRACGRDH